MAGESSPDNRATGSAARSESVRDTVQSILIALILAFVFRAYVVEAFVIPTGSMAPTLLGEHIRLDDYSSGRRWSMDLPRGATQQWRMGPGGQREAVRGASLNHALNAIAPMTLHEQTLSAGTTRRSGDRILVHKFIYNWIEPRRWDVIVFKAPHEPVTNYIKRLVGLPGEQLLLLDGNVYVSQDQGATWQIARKTDPSANRHWRAIQESLWQPIYDSNVVPLDAMGDLPGDSVAPASRWLSPWQPLAGSWQAQGRQSYTLTSQHGGLGFDFSAIAADRWYMQYPYNQLDSQHEPPGGMTPMEDIRLAMDVVPAAGREMVLELSTTARLASDPDDALRRLVLRIKQDGHVELLLANDAATDQTTPPLAQATLRPLPAGRATHVEFWYVDQQAIVFINGREMLRHAWDWPFDVILNWPGPQDHPDIRITATGGPLTLANVRLDRDLFYTVMGQSGHLGRGGMRRTPQGTQSRGPVAMGPDDFFALGDNSPASLDSRFLPWRPHENADHALVQYQTWGKAGEHDGLIHRDLLIGRAFMVYFPAPIWRSGVPAPDFGQIRAIR